MDLNVRDIIAENKKAEFDRALGRANRIRNFEHYKPQAFSGEEAKCRRGLFEMMVKLMDEEIGHCLNMPMRHLEDYNDLRDMLVAFADREHRLYLESMQ